jgi:hypothetical protein
MDINDINENILSYLDDYDSIKNFCQINSSTQYLCSQNYFWKILFNQWGYTYPEPLPQTPNEWQKSFRAIYGTNQIIGYLNNNDIKLDPYGLIVKTLIIIFFYFNNNIFLIK